MNNFHACLLFWAGLQIGLAKSTPAATVTGQPQKIVAIIRESAVQITEVGSTVRYNCAGRSEDNDTVSIEWQKESGQLPLGRSYDDTRGILIIRDVKISDGGIYFCLVTDGVNIAAQKLYLTVEEICVPPPQPPLPTIAPIDWVGGSGETVRLVCVTHLIGVRVIWSRLGNHPLPISAVEEDGVLMIPNASPCDSGFYVCTAIIYRGVESSTTASVSIRSQIGPSVVKVDPERQVVLEGTFAEMKCVVTGDPTPCVTWTKLGERLGPHIRAAGNTLRIVNPSISDQGIYVCHAANSEGSSQASAELKIEPVENSMAPPPPIIDPGDWLGDSDDTVHQVCTARHAARVIWTRSGNAPLPATAYVHEGNLTIYKPTSSDSGSYVCTAITHKGVKTSSSVRITIRPLTMRPPSVRVEPVRLTVSRGSLVQAKCIATGKPTPNITWIKLGESLDGARFKNLNNTLTIVNPQVSDRGTYVCRATNSGGTAQARVVVEVERNDKGESTTPYITEENLTATEHSKTKGRAMDDEDEGSGSGDSEGSAMGEDFDFYFDRAVKHENNGTSVSYGESIVIACGVALEASMIIQWHKLGSRLPNNSRTFDNKLELMAVKAEDAGTYICTANHSRMSIEVSHVLVVTGVLPHFSQVSKSYMSFPCLPDTSLKFNIEVSFKPESYDGIILYNGQLDGGDGDFVLLSLIDGYPEFRFKLGSSLAVIQGQRPITLGKWHTIRLERVRKEGLMLVDDESPYTGSTSGVFQILYLTGPLYLGGVPDYNAINRQTSATSGFVGCISRLVIGDKKLDLNVDYLSTMGVTTCETCVDNPCSNNGVCQEAAVENGYTCLCPAGYGGKHCSNIVQTCNFDPCGEGTCAEKEDGVVCSCPLGKTGSKCEFDVNFKEPAYHNSTA